MLTSEDPLCIKYCQCGADWWVSRLEDVSGGGSTPVVASGSVWRIMFLGAEISERRAECASGKPTQVRTPGYWTAHVIGESLRSINKIRFKRKKPLATLQRRVVTL